MRYTNPRTHALTHSLTHQASGHPDVDGLGERAGRHATQQAAALRRDGENREDAQRGPRRRRLEVDPEGQPR